MSDEYDIAKKATLETEKLMTARRGLAQLQKDEEKYLADRELRAQQLLADVHGKIGAAGKIYEKVIEKILAALGRAGKIASDAEREAGKLVKTAQGILASAQSFEERMEKGMHEATRRMEMADKQTRKNSAKEKELKAEKEKVDKKSANADRKLAKARDLAFWHKEPGKVYQDD